LTEAYNASGQALFRELARKPGNIVISPYSIGTAMAMARAGARGETALQMTKVLGHTLPLGATDSANAALLAKLAGYAKTSEPERSVKLLAANALMVTPVGGQAISQPFRALVRDKYGAAVHEGADLDTVNSWVREKTQGKIDRILDKLDPDAAAVILNAVYLKAPWASAFHKTATRDEDFHLSSAKTVRVKTMHQRESFALAEGARYRAIRLDYVERSLGMVIVLPNDVDGLGAATDELDAPKLASLLAELRGGRHTPVALALPRFKAELRVGLAPLFKAAGMTLAFDRKAADFSGMLGERADRNLLHIGDIQHRAVIEVTEPGTEAAAATAVVMTKRSLLLPDAVPFVVDRPFLFYVVDDASGAILFQGRIVDPRQS
jgi:serpin B